MVPAIGVDLFSILGGKPKFWERRESWRESRPPEFWGGEGRTGGSRRGGRRGSQNIINSV